MPDSEKFDILRRLSFFRGFTDVELWEVLRVTVWHKHPAGTTLIKEGDIGKSFFIMVTGEVKVTMQEKLLNILRPGDCFGEMAYLGKQQFRRTASVEASTDIDIIEIPADALEQASELTRHHFNGAFLEILVDRLAQANLRLSKLLAERNVSVY
jgi:CRP-like cAMP-binding protein